MTTICVRYLVEKDVDHLHTDNDTISTPSGADTFWTYSAEHWAAHVRSIQDEAFLFPMDRVINLYNTSEERFQNWFPILWRAIESWEIKKDNIKPYMNSILLAALTGHHTVLQRLLETHLFDLDKTDEEGRAALILGSRFGYEKIVQLLLDNEVDFNAKSEVLGDALILASIGGYNEIVQLLLDNGADINAQNEDFGSAQQIVIKRGYSEIVQLLLDNGADVNAQDGKSLQVALQRSSRKIVQRLLDNGADMSSYKVYGSAIQVASSFGRSKVVQILIDNGADINAPGGAFGNALKRASLGGYSETLQLLLDNGAKDTRQAVS
ncbi:MAG: hypothetical protein LQ342_006610 [Letrouitia transgressa]|nr:MAG: hypothetical protein LQ342_006610 [Letrouitia transgressa]